MLRLLGWIAVLGVLGAAAWWIGGMPRRLPPAVVAALPEGDAARGEIWFWAGGCSACHAAERAEGEARLSLGGGREIGTPYGSFVAPNVSMHPEDGIGGWSAGDFANAMLRGVSPDGRHYYPSFPYTSYTRMEPAHVADLWAFMQTLPAVAGTPPDHQLAFPYTLRRGLGLWKLAFLSDEPVAAIDATDPQLARGRYLVEGPGHCGECHTPRNVAGAMDLGLWLAGAPSPDGPGRVPNITPGGDVGRWSEGDVAYFLESGFTPEFDTAGGDMVAVQKNLAMLADDDHAAIAAYLKAVPARPTAR